jgi:hypothetical protein
MEFSDLCKNYNFLNNQKRNSFLVHGFPASNCFGVIREYRKRETSERPIAPFILNYSLSVLLRMNY